MSDLFSLAGKTALVTGASGGLGAHFCRTLGKAGAAVVLAGRRIEPLQRLADELRESGVAAHPLSLDVTDPESVRAGFEQAQTLCGPIDIAICNAGITVTKDALALASSEWDQVLDVNLKGCWLVASAITSACAAEQLCATTRLTPTPTRRPSPVNTAAPNGPPLADSTLRRDSPIAKRICASASGYTAPASSSWIHGGSVRCSCA